MKKIIFSLLITLPLLSFAGGFQLNVQGLKAIAMGGAFTGVSSDASSVFFNPGGMSNLNGHNFTFGINVVDPYISLQTPETANIDQTTGKATPFHFYYSGELTEKMNVGFLVNNQFGSSSSFEDNWQGRYIIQNISLKTFMFQPTLSYKIHEKLSLGAGFVYTRGSFSTEKAIPVASSLATEGKARLEGSGDGVGFNIGIYSQFLTIGDEAKQTKFAIGLDYRSKLAIDLGNGLAEFTDIPNSLKSKFPENTSFTSKIILPSVFTVGISVKHIKTDKWSLEFAYDLNLTGWSSYDTLAFNFDNNDTPDSKITKDWEDVITHRLGLDFTYKNKYSVRAGLYIDNTPMKDGFVSPELPGMTQTAYTAGLGYKVSDMFSVDFSYIRQNAEREASLDADSFSAKYKRIVNVYSLGLNIKFGVKTKDSTPTE
jgi:long-chain fatty acid transport protein